MIGLITGTLLAKQPPEIMIQAGGIGYEISMSMHSIYALPTEGQPVTVFTHFVVREDAQLLFGFIEKEERTVFRELIKANGVGPKLAITILSGMSVQDLIRAVGYEDVSSLVKIPGMHPIPQTPTQTITQTQPKQPKMRPQPFLVIS